MLSRFVQPRDRLLATTSSQSLVKAYAERDPGRDVRVMVVNDDPSESYPVTISVPGYTTSPASRLESYGENSSAPTSRLLGRGSLTVSPYSITTVDLVPAQGPRR
jgi:hypothetical protein